MRKLKKGRKLSRIALATALFSKEKIKTTEAKAKEISGFVEKQITRARIGNLQSRRLLRRYFSSELVKKIVNEIAPRYKDKKGGYTRIIKLGPRKSDGAKMAIIELVK